MITPAPLPLATLDAVLERITYANEETGYTVARVMTGRRASIARGSSIWFLPLTQAGEPTTGRSARLLGKRRLVS